MAETSPSLKGRTRQPARAALPAGHNRKQNMAKRNNANGVMIETGTRKSQAFSLVAPTAMSVQLVGDFTGWQQKPINMKKGPQGIWQTTVQLQPGAHHYRFLVDGQWRDDPACALRVPNPYGGQDAVCQIA